jgi:quercetin dioxygenase-like cupin family protein
MKREYPVVHLEDVLPEPVSEEGGWKKMDIRFVITGERQGSKNCTMFRALFSPGARHMKHSHSNSDELFYMIRGHGASGAGEKEYEMKAGSCHFIPRGVTHWLRNLSETEPIEVVGVYLNAGNLKESGYVFEGEVTEVDKTIKRREILG